MLKRKKIITSNWIYGAKLINGKTTPNKKKNTANVMEFRDQENSTVSCWYHDNN